MANLFPSRDAGLPARGKPEVGRIITEPLTAAQIGTGRDAHLSPFPVSTWKRRFGRSGDAAVAASAVFRVELRALPVLGQRSTLINEDSELMADGLGLQRPFDFV